MIKFRHYRNVNADGTVSSNGGATLAFCDDEGEKGKFFAGSFAFCNDKDNYCRAYGRAKAKGMLTQNASKGYSMTDNERHFVIHTDTAATFLGQMDEEAGLLGLSPR